MKPTLAEVKDYVESAGLTGADTDEQLASALASEADAQAARCNVPAEDADWPADLSEALCRRVVVNLALRTKPLGLETSASEAGVGFARIGGRDAEVNRLEGPYRKRLVG